MAEFNIVGNVLFQLQPGQIAAINRDIQSGIKPISLPVDTAGATSLNNATKAVSDSMKAVRDASVAASGGVNTFDKAAAAATGSMQGAAKVTFDVSKLLENLGNQAGLAAKRFLAMSVVAATMGSVAIAITGATREAIAFERQMASIAQVTGQTKGQLAGLAGQITDISKALGVSSGELADATVQLKKLGLDAKGTEEALNAIAKASLSVNFDGVKGATDTAVVAMRQFNLEAGKLDETLGSINAVSNKFNVNAKDITEAIRVAGSTFRQTGSDLNELVAIFASAKGTTEEAAGGIASSLRLVFSRIQRNDVATGLKDLGINLRYTREEAERLGNTKLEGQFVGALDAVQRLSGALKNLQSTDPRYVSVLEQLGGARNVSRVIPLLQQVGDAERALLVAQTGAISTSVAQEKALDTLSGRASQVTQEFLGLGRAILGSNEFQAIAKDALSFASALVQILDVVRPLVPLLTTMATIKVVQNLGNITGAFTRRFASAPGINNTEIARATGGPIPGVGDTDSVPAMLTPGEFVINKRAAASIGLSSLHRLNAQGFAGGGIVSQRRALFGRLSPAAIFSGLSDDDTPKKTGGFTESEIDALTSYQKPEDLENQTTNRPYLGTGNLNEFWDYRLKKRIERGLPIQMAPEGVRVDSFTASPKIAAGKTANLRKFANGGLVEAARYYSTGDSVDPETDSERRKKAGLRAKQILSDDDLHKLYQLVEKEALKQHGGSAYSRELNRQSQGEADDIIKYKTFLGLRNFNPAKHTNPETGQAFSAADIGNEALTNEATYHVFRRVKKGLSREFDTTQQFQARGSAGDDVYDPIADIASGASANAVEKQGRFAAGPKPVLPDRIPEGSDEEKARQYAADLLAKHGLTGVKRSRNEKGKIESRQEQAALSAALKEVAGTRLDEDALHDVISGTTDIPTAQKVAAQSKARQTVAQGRPPSPIDPINQLIQAVNQLTAALRESFNRIKGGIEYSGTKQVIEGEIVGSRPGTPSQAEKTIHYVGGQKQIPYSGPAGLLPPPESPRLLGYTPEKPRPPGGPGIILGPGGQNAQIPYRPDVFDHYLFAGDASESSRIKKAGRRSTKVSDEGYDLLPAGIGNRQRPSQAEAQRRIYEHEFGQLAGTYDFQDYAGKNGKYSRSSTSAEALLGKAQDILSSNYGQLKGAGQAFRSDVGRGASAAGRFFRGIPGAIGGAIGEDSKLNQGLTNRLGGLGGTVGLAATLALPYVAEGVGHLGGTAEAAATSGNGSNYKLAKGASGALSGVALGATVGSVIPGVGTAIGAVAGGAIGGIYGFVTSLKEAEKEIRDVKINNALSEFADKIHTLATGSLDSATLDAARTNLKVGVENTTEKNKEDATHFFGGFKYDEFAALQKKSLRNEFAPQLPDIQQTLNRQTESAARAGPNKGVDAVLSEVRNGGNGLNKELLDLTARVRGVPLSTVLDELKKVIERTQRDIQVQKEAQDARKAEEGSVNAFSRLLLNVEAAASSLDDLKRNAKILGDAFDGASQSIHVSSHADNLSGIGRNDKGFLEPLDLIRKVGGSTGESLYRTGKGADDVAGVLQSVLARVASENPNDGAEFATRTRRGVVSALGLKQDAIPKDIEKALAIVTHGLNRDAGSHGPSGILKEMQADSGKYAEKLLSPLVDPIKDVGGKIAKSIEEEGNRFVDGLQVFRRQLEAIGEGRDRVANIGVAGTRSNTERAAIANYQGERTLDFLSLPQLQAGLQSRQERLTGFAGAAANDPNGIASALSDTRGRIQAAAANQQKVFDQTGGKGPQFQAAAEQLSQLRDKAANLQRALGHLADYSERNAAAQEKLARLNQEQEGRRGIVERFASADPEEQIRLARGVQLSQVANARGSLDGFTSEDRKSIIDFLRSAQNVTLNLPKGQQTGGDALKQLLDNTFGGVGKLTEGQQNEQENLRDVIANNFKNAETAQTKYVADLEKNSNDFIKNLRETHNQFYTKLADIFLVREQLQQKKQELTDAGEKKRTAQEKVDQGNLLRGAGITDTDKLIAAQNGKGTLQQYAGAYEGLQRQRKLNASVLGGFNQFFDANVAGDIRKLNTKDPYDDTPNNYELGGKNIQEKLGKNISSRLTEVFGHAGLSSEQADRAVGNFADIFNKNSSGGALTAQTSEKDALQIVKTSLRQAIAQELEGDKGLGKHQADIARLAPGARALAPNLEGLNQILGQDKGSQKFQEALGAFDAKGNTIEKFNGGLDAATKNFEDLNKQVAALTGYLNKVGAPPEAQAKAGGGPIFSARGSDTVPAMLTPGEFVVNSASAQANSGALQKINSAKGPAYLADGGPTDFQRWKQQKAAQADQTTDFQKWKDSQNSDDKPTDFKRWQAGELKFGGPQVEGDFRNLKAKPIQADSGPTDFDIWKRDQENRGPTDFERWKARQPAPAIPDAGPHDAGPQVGGPDPAAAVEDMRDAQKRALAGGNIFGDDFLKVAQQGANQAAFPDRPGRPVQAQGGGLSPLAAALALYGNQNPNGASANFITEFNAPKKGNLAGAILDQQATAGNIAAFQRKALFGYLPGEGGQHAINQGVLGVEDKYRAQEQRRNLSLQNARRARLPAGQIGIPYRFASGGIVPGSGSGDTVPSLLTPGEGVLTRGAVASVGGESGVQKLNSGGVVKSQYLANGGQAQGGADFGGFSEAASKLSEAINSFAGNATSLAEAISQMPRTLTGNFTHNVTVTLNGAEVLAKLQPELERMVVSEAKEQIGRIFKEHLPDAGVSVQ